MWAQENAVLLDIQAAKAQQRGNLSYGRVSLAHEFELDLSLRAHPPGFVNAAFKLSELIDPEMRGSGFTHDRECVPSLLSSVAAELAGILASNEPFGGTVQTRSQRRPSHAPADVKTLLKETVDLCVTRGLLPSFEESGKVQRPRHKSPLVDAEAWELAHYATAVGPLYQDGAAWQAAHDLVESFTPAGLAKGRFARNLPNAFGPLKGISTDWVAKNINLLLDRCGNGQSTTGAGGFESVFRARSSSTVADLPEPYGKWLQLEEGRPRWRQPVDLELVVKVGIDADPVSGDACLSVHLSTLAVPFLERLAAAINDLLGLAVVAPALTTPPRLPPSAGPPGPTKKRPPAPGGRRERLPQGSWRF